MDFLTFEMLLDKIQHIKEQIQQIQTDMMDHYMVHANREQERELRQQLEKWSLVGECYEANVKGAMANFR